jgi:AraC-like DNA-binding protein/ligand-binding sensor protein
MPADRFIQSIARSELFRSYERAFKKATGLGLNLLPPGAVTQAFTGKKATPFCSLIGMQKRGCAACLQVQEQLSRANKSPKSVICFAGLCDSAVPVRAGNKVIGLLHTGQVFFRKPTRAQFARTTRTLLEWGLKVDVKQFEEAYFQMRVITPKQYRAVLALLSVFADHLSLVSNQIALQEQAAPSPAVTRAREYIQTHQADDLSLEKVARVVNTSASYFCRLFRKTTGMKFTEYVTRLRIERARNLLLNPHVRISEVAYEVGFQSLTHFNRSFRQVVGQSPTKYRETARRFFLK